MKQNEKTIIYTDLDGTFLDEKNFSFRESLPALRVAQESGVPVIFFSSKTRAEIEHLRKALEVNDLFSLARLTEGIGQQGWAEAVMRLVLSLLLVFSLTATPALAYDGPQALKEKENPQLIGNRDINKAQLNFYSLEKEVAIGRQMAAETDRYSREARRRRPTCWRSSICGRQDMTRMR